MLLIGLLRPGRPRAVVPLVTLVALGASIVIEHLALAPPGVDHLRRAARWTGWRWCCDMIFAVAAIAAVMLSLRAPATRSAGHGEYNSLMLFSVLGMAILVSAQNLVTLFVGFELLSIPLYVSVPRSSGARARWSRG